MDRFFLAGLVRETRPGLLRRRARGAVRWGEAGLSIPLSGAPPLAIVISLFSEAPGWYLGAPPRGELLEPAPLPRLKKLLFGAEVVDVDPSPLDRSVRFQFKRARPSGAHSNLELIVEWIAGRHAAYLVEPASARVLDVFSRTPPRQVAGQIFTCLPPPPGAGPLAAGGADFAERLACARASSETEAAAIAAASGLSPLLAAEVERLHSQGGLGLIAAFEEVRRRLVEASRPTLLHPPASLRPSGPSARLSPVDLEPPPGWTKESFSGFNAAARACLAGLGLLAERRLRGEIAAALARQLKKEKDRAARLARDLAELPDAEELRRLGEALLAGLREARPVEGGVEVTDPYSSEGRSIRVPLDPRRDLPGNAQRYFQRSRKVARSKERLSERREQLQARLDYLGTLEVGLDSARAVEELKVLRDELREAGIGVGKKPGLAIPGKPARAGEGRFLPLRFRSSRGGWILVGRSARSNEELTFRLAKPDELWFHAAGTPGAHVVLRREEGTSSSPEEIVEAAAAAAFFSKARGATAAEVVFTERKHVRKLPGAPPGTVRVARFQAVRVRPAEPSRRED